MNRTTTNNSVSRESEFCPTENGSGIGVPSYKVRNRAYKALPQEGSLQVRRGRESEFPPTRRG